VGDGAVKEATVGLEGRCGMGWGKSNNPGTLGSLGDLE